MWKREVVLKKWDFHVAFPNLTTAETTFLPNVSISQAIMTVIVFSCGFRYVNKRHFDNIHSMKCKRIRTGFH